MLHAVVILEGYFRRIPAFTVLLLASVFFLKESPAGRILSIPPVIRTILIHRSLLLHHTLRALPPGFSPQTLKLKQLSFHTSVGRSEFLVLLENSVICGTILLKGLVAGEIDDLGVVGEEGAVLPVLFHSKNDYYGLLLTSPIKNGMPCANPSMMNTFISIKLIPPHFACTPHSQGPESKSLLLNFPKDK